MWDRGQRNTRHSAQSLGRTGWEVQAFSVKGQLWVVGFPLLVHLEFGSCRSPAPCLVHVELCAESCACQEGEGLLLHMSAFEGWNLSPLSPAPHSFLSECTKNRKQRPRGTKTLRGDSE